MAASTDAVLWQPARGWRPSLAVGMANPSYLRSRSGICRRVAEVDPSLAADVDRELARMRQKDAAAERRQKKQWKGAFSR